MRKLLFLIIYSIVFPAMGQIPAGLELKDAVNNNLVDVLKSAGSKGMVLLFASPECPYDQYYKGRITALANSYRLKGVSFVLVNSDAASDQQQQLMQQYIKELNFNAPFLIDSEKRLAQAVGASKSPEAFLFKNEGGDLKLFYKGAIDNNPQVAADVKENYLKENLELLLQGKSASPADVRPTGCRIK